MLDVIVLYKKGVTVLSDYVSYILHQVFLSMCITKYVIIVDAIVRVNENLVKVESCIAQSLGWSHDYHVSCDQIA